MRKKLTFAVAHPGRHHAFQLAAGCRSLGLPTALFTPLYRKGIGTLLSRAPASIGKKASSYHVPGLTPSEVYSPTRWQLLALYHHLQGTSAGMAQWFDRDVSRMIKCGKLRAEVFVTLQDYMPLSVKSAKAAGMHIWTDQILNQSDEAIGRLRHHAITYLPQKFKEVQASLKHSEHVNHKILQQADLVTVPSNYCLDGIKSQTVHKKVYTVPYGSILPPLNDRPNFNAKDGISIVARANSLRKGGHLLLRALEIMPRSSLTSLDVSNITVRIIGSLEPAINELLQVTKIPDYIEIKHGNLPHSEVLNELQRAAFFVMPSLSESMSLACIEAMACGLPLVITQYCGIDRFVDGQMGFLTLDDPQRLAATLIRMLHCQPEWGHLGSTAREIAKSYSWPKYHEAIAKVAETLVK